MLHSGSQMVPGVGVERLVSGADVAAHHALSDAVADQEYQRTRRRQMGMSKHTEHLDGTDSTDLGGLNKMNQIE